MRVIGRELLENFLISTEKDRADIDLWLHEVNNAQWNSFNDIRTQYIEAGWQKKNVVVFKLNSLKCFLTTKISFINKIILIEDISSPTNFKGQYD